MEFPITPAEEQHEADHTEPDNTEPEADVNELDPVITRAALLRAPWYIAERTVPGKVDAIRHAIVLRHQRGAGASGSPQQLASEVKRYFAMYGHRLPSHPVMRAETVANAVATAFGVHMQQVLPYAIANVANLRVVPPRDEIPRIKEQLAAGETPSVSPDWEPADTSISTGLYERYLHHMDDEDILDVAGGIGLFVPTVSNPPLQKLYGYDIDSGHADAIPFLNVTANALAQHVPAPEALSVHRRKKVSRPLSPRSARRSLAETGMSALQKSSLKQTGGHRDH